MLTVSQACDANYLAHIADCSGFANAVAKAVGVSLTGNADAIVDVLRSDANDWTILPDGPAAAAAATAGKLVIGGLKGSEQATPDRHGHVVVVIPGPLNRDKYPTAWWGSLGGHPGKNQTINWAWNEADRDRVSYAAHDVV